MKTLIIDYDERLTDSTKNAIKEQLIKLASEGKIKAFELCEFPPNQFKPVCGFGVIEE